MTAVWHGFIKLLLTYADNNSSVPARFSLFFVLCHYDMFTSLCKTQKKCIKLFNTPNLQ